MKWFRLSRLLDGSPRTAGQNVRHRELRHPLCGTAGFVLPPSQHLEETKDGVGSVDGLVCRDVVRPGVISKRYLLPEIPDLALEDLQG